MEGKHKILVVDDVPMFRELCAVFLARTGNVLTAAGGHEALEMVRCERPDLVVTDLQMPEMDGEALCRAIKSEAEIQDTPVIIVVSGEDPKERGRAARAGADDLLSKPLSRLQLTEAVSRFLRYDVVRGLPRVQLAEPVRIVGDTVEGWGTLRNLSRGGAFVETQCEFEPASEVDLRFQLPETGSPVAPTARIIWQRDSEASAEDGPSGTGGMGLRFLEVDGDTARQLDDFVFVHSAASQLQSGGSVG